MIIKRMILSNWKNFVHADVHLTDRTFLVGPNASGKSNFLDAIRFLNDIAKSGGSLENALIQRGGLQKIRCLSARKKPNVSITIFVGNRGNGGPIWEYQLALAQESRGTHRTLISSEYVKKDGILNFERPDDDDNMDSMRLTQTYLEQINANQSFREVYNFLSSVRYIHLIPQLIRQPELFFNTAIKPTDDSFGFHFIESLVKTPKNTLRSRLRKIENVLKIAVPQLTNLTETRDESGVPHLEALYEHWRPNAGKQQEKQFSDGTIRLIGLLWSILENRSVLLLEEPELSLHPGIVGKLPALFAQLISQKKDDRQTILSTHSSDLLSDESISSKDLLLFEPGSNGTNVRSASEITEIKVLLESGFHADEAVLPYTEPKNIYQIELFDK